MVKNRVKEYRVALGWSQEQLARKSGVSRTTISETESGSHIPTLETALRLAEAMDTTVNKLFHLI